MPAPDDPLDHLPTLRPEGSGGAAEPVPVHPAEGDELDYAPTLRGLRAGLKVFGQRYQLVRQLGRGGMGVVWLARDGKLDLDVALKFLPEGLQDDLVAVEELRSETKRCLKLTHPLIVRTFDLVEGDDMTAIAMEFIDGHTLNELRMQQPARVFEAADLRTWLQQLCEALTYAHTEARLVHRDLKPSNVMITTNGRLKLADFGIASGLSDTMSRLTRAGANPGAGTLVYMSPQQVMGFPPTVADDIYSLGATLYELITGKPPFFRGSIERQIETLVPPSMAERRVELEAKSTALIPAAWEKVVGACLEKDKDKRPQSAAAVWQMLHAAPATRPPMARRTLPIVPPPPKPVVVRKASSKSLVLGLAAVLVACGIGYFAIGTKKEPAKISVAAAAAPPAPTAEELQRQALEKRAAEVAAMVKAGAEAYHRSDLAEARRKLEGALALEPSNTEASRVLDEVKTEEARQVREKQMAAQLATKKQEVATLVADARRLFGYGSIDAAKEKLLAALYLLPNDSTALSLLSEITDAAKRERERERAAQAAAMAPVPAPAVVYTPPPPVEPTLPASGYFPIDQVFDGTSYDSYNTYSRGLILKKAQEKLRSEGLYRSTADGEMGPGTQQAIIAYQRQHGIPPTGKLDQATQSSLNLASMTESNPATASNSKPADRASLDAKIRELQQSRSKMNESQERLRQLMNKIDE